MARSAPLYRDEWPRIAANIQRLGTDGIKEARRKEFEKCAEQFAASKAKYIELEKATRVPAPLIYCIHKREGDANWNTYMGNGQSLAKRTTIVPEGRGPWCSELPAPFSAFRAGCVDAFGIDGLSHVMQEGDDWDLGTHWGSWPVEKMIYYAIKLNGWGYWQRGLVSPYGWGGTIVQQPGKYVSDGKFDANVWDSQPGVAPMLWMIGAKDDSIHYSRES